MIGACRAVLLHRPPELAETQHQHPLGLVMYGACDVDGTVQVTQVWDSEEHARRYYEEVLKPAFKLAGAPMDAEIHTFELLHLVTP